MRQVVAFTAVLVAALASGRVAQALPITVTINSNLASNTYLAGSVSGQFDLSAVLTNNTLVSASLSFRFYDDGDPLQFAGSSQTGYAGGPSVYTRSETRYYHDPYESVTVSTSSGNTTSGSTSYSSGSYNGYNQTGTGSYIAYYQEYTYSYSCGTFSTCYGTSYYPVYATSYYYTYYYTQQSGYTGSFSAAQTLNTAGLADLADGILPFTLWASGDSRLSYATLTATLEPLAVPEHTHTALLLLLGTGLMVAGRRLVVGTKL